MLTSEQKADLRNLLTIVRGNAQLLAADVTLDPAVRARARAIEESGLNICIALGFVEEDLQLRSAIAKSYNGHLGTPARSRE